MLSLHINGFLFLLASDLFIVSWKGVITEDVVQLRQSIGAPGMAVLQFGISFKSSLYQVHYWYFNLRNS